MDTQISMFNAFTKSNYKKIIPLKSSKTVNMFHRRFSPPYIPGDFIIAIAPLTSNFSVSATCNTSVFSTYNEVFSKVISVINVNMPKQYFTFLRNSDKLWGALALRHDAFDGSDILENFPIEEIDGSFSIQESDNSKVIFDYTPSTSSVRILEHIKSKYNGTEGFCEYFNLPVCSKAYGARVEANRISWDSSENEIKNVIAECKKNTGLITNLMNATNMSGEQYDNMIKYIGMPNNLVSILNLPYPLIFMMKNTKYLNFYVSRTAKGSIITVTLPDSNANSRNQWEWLKENICI